MSFEDMVRAMDATGVEKSMLVQAATCYGYDNSYLADAVKAHPDRLGGVFTIDALAADAPKQMEYWVSKGLKGARLFTTGSTMPDQATWFADAAAYPYWQKAVELALPICLQMSWRAIPQLKDILTRFPRVKVILDHISRPPIDDGHPYEQARPFFDLADYQNLYLKITPVNVLAMRQAPATPESFMSRLVSTFGAERIAWGSNFPSSTKTLQEALEMDLHAAHALSETQRLKIFRETALSLYPSLA